MSKDSHIDSQNKHSVEFLKQWEKEKKAKLTKKGEGSKVSNIPI